MWWWLLAVVGDFNFETLLVANDTNHTRVCDQNSLTHIVRFMDMAVLPNTLGECEIAVADNPNFTLAFKRTTWLDINLDAAAAPTNDTTWAAERDLVPPSFSSCKHVNTYCPPGPCQFFDMDYQYEDDHLVNRNREMHKADAAGETWDMTGVPRCGARFGLQMINKKLKQTFPTTISSKTADIFFISTDSTALYGPDTQKCPVAFWAGVNSNLNPQWYYRSELFRRYNEPQAMPANYCSKPRPPPGSRATADGMAWGKNPFTWGAEGDVSRMRKEGTDMVGSGVGNTYQHGVYDNLDQTTVDTVRYFNPAFSGTLEPDPKPTWPPLAFSVPQLIPVNETAGFTIDDAHAAIDYENTICDLTQCAWAPTETRKEDQVWAAVNCMMAEMLQWYVYHADNDEISKTFAAASVSAPPNAKCWKSCIPPKQGRHDKGNSATKLATAKSHCCSKYHTYTTDCPGSNVRCSDVVPLGQTSANTWVDLFPEPVENDEGAKLGDHFPLMCAKAWPTNFTPGFKAGTEPSDADYSTGMPDAWSQEDKMNINTLFTKATCHDGSTFGEVIKAMYIGDANVGYAAGSHEHVAYNRLANGIPTVWGCQPKQTFEGDSTQAKRSRSKKRNRKKHADMQRNLVQSMKGDAYTALMHPNDGSGWTDEGVTCNQALRQGHPGGNLNNTGCGFIANTMYTYTVKKKMGVDEFYAKLWGAAFGCILDVTRTDGLNVDKTINPNKAQLKSIAFDAGVAAADMAIDSWAFMMDIPDNADETEAAHYEPMEWAIAGTDQWVPADTVLNASFPNSADLQQTEACNCGGARPIYRTLGTVWQEVKRPEYIFLKAEKNWTDQIGPTENVMVIEAGYGWNTNVEGQANEQPIGLQIPSNPLYTPDLVLVERDILHPNNVTIKPQQLVEDYFTSPNAPNKENLLELLYMAERNRSNHRYTEHRIRFQYGSCMRFPYGQLPRMSMTKENQDYLFKTDNTTFDADFWVGSQSQMGYCELFGPYKQHAFCLADGYSMSKRVEFCSKPQATHVVLGLGLRDRGFSDICNVAQKVCWIIPGTPGWETINLVISGPSAPAGVLENYTVLIAPFNWTVAAGILAPNRYVYEVGGLILPEPLDDADTARFGMRAMKLATFAQLRSTTGSVDDIQKATADIKSILQETCQSNDITKCDLSAFGWGESVSLDTAYTPMLESGIRVNHAGMTIASSDGMPLQFARAGALAATTRPCTVFYVAAARFRTTLDFEIITGCTHMPPLDRTAVVFGGSDVGGADITLTTVGVEMPVAFMGDDTMSFTQTSDCWLGVSTVRVSGPDIQYAAGLARASGELIVHSEDPTLRVLIQPRRSDNLTLNRPVINISAYTNIFGDPFMSHVYSEHLALYNRLILPLFVVLVAIITGGVILLGVHFARILKE
jgi:hypothetical protein